MALTAADIETRAQHLTVADLRRELEYDPASGVFRWRLARPGVSVGGVAGSISVDGYRRIRVFYRRFHASVLAWLYVTGEWPDRPVDHKNGTRDDDRFDNLRLATVHQNNANRLGWRSHAGPKGVYKRNSGWEAAITFHGKYHYLGKFETADAADAAYQAAASRLFGEFAREDRSC